MVIGVPRKGSGRAKEAGLGLEAGISAALGLAEKKNVINKKKNHNKKNQLPLKCDFGMLGLPLGWGGLWCSSFA